MYGFQPKHLRDKPVQKLADGGMVHSIKGMLGLRPRTPDELRAADAKAQARNQEAAAAVAERAKAAPAPSPAPSGGAATAVSSYAGMTAVERREKAAGFKSGGVIRGPGTATSDSIETEKVPGTFIMPADSTKAIGPDALEDMGEKVPVRLSNGEFEFPPDQVQALGEAVLTVMRDATHKVVGKGGGKMRAAAGFVPAQVFANGGMVQDEEDRKRRIAQIPVGGTMPAPPADGSGSSEFTRNVNNGLNALGGMGVVASVPLRAPAAARELRGAYQTLTGPAAKAAAPTADFIAGAGPNATTMANTIPRLGNAPTPVLPGTNAALQQGAQANAMSGAVRAASGAGAGATGLANTQPNDPTTAAPAAAPAPAAPSEYSRQMSAVGGALADGAAWLGKTIVSAPGYGLSKPSAAPAPAVSATTTAGAGRGAINPAPVNPTQPVATATAPTDDPTDAPAAPTQPPTNEVMPGVYRHGRGQYSDNAAGMGMPANFTGQPSAQNMAAADALAGRQSQESAARVQQAPAGFSPTNISAPVVRNSTNDWAARKALENAATSASSITNNGGKFDRSGPGDSVAMAGYKAMLGTDQALQQAQVGLEQEGMRQNGGLQREALQQDGATTRTGMTEQGANAREAGRNALTAEELGLRREAQGFQTRAAQQKEQLRNVLVNPKATPEQRAMAQRSLAAMSDKTAADRMQTVTLPDTTNEMGQVVRGGQALVRVLEDGSVQQVPIGAQQGAALPPGMKRQIGTSNGRPVYEDMNGKQVIAKG